MDTKPLVKLFFLLVMAGVCCAGACTTGLKSSSDKKATGSQCIEKNKVDSILERLKQQTTRLNSYQAQIEYRYSQPLFESETLRTGRLFYKRDDKGSKLRINFQTLRQDDEKSQKYIEQIIFDGVWLIRIDYQIETVKYDQLADVNEPIDAFDFAGAHLPIVGFANVEELKNQFEITFIEPNGPSRLDDFEHLHLKVKKGSTYQENYKTIDFWLDKKGSLPAKIVATTVEDESYDIKLLNPKINKKLKNAVFEVETPKHFDKNIVPLKSEPR